jgi:hypothetical protein
MTWLKFGVASLVFSFTVSAAAAFEVVDTNNGFAGPAFTQMHDDEDSGGGYSGYNVNQDDFADQHIVMKGDNEKEFDGYSYSGFVFEDQVKTPANLMTIDAATVETSTDTSKTAKR